MEKITAVCAIAGVLVGFVYAPLFHVHGGADGVAAVVHAHFPEPETIPPYTAFSSHHSHWAARSVDVLTAAASQIVHIDAVITGTPLEFNPGHTAFGFAHSDDVPRTHAPPVIESRSPRSPPF